MARCPVCALEYAAEEPTDPCPRCARATVPAPAGPAAVAAADAGTAVTPPPRRTETPSPARGTPSSRAAPPLPGGDGGHPGGTTPARGTTTVGTPAAGAASARARATEPTPVRTSTKDPSTGSIIAGYQLAERVGDGATSAVYKAIAPDKKQPVAVKVLQAAHAADQEALERFNREARLARRIKHPNLVRVHESGKDETSGAHYLVMDLVEGKTLEQMIKDQGRLRWRPALELLYQIAQAVAQLHRHGCVHRDIKPSNILVEKGVAKLTDLGFVKPVSEAPNEHDALIMGTPAYMAPEQSVDAREATHVADVYALGATLYHALTGQPPFSGTDTEQILRQAREREPAPLRDLAPDVPRSVEALVRWSMAKQPRARPADAQTLCLAIQRILGNPQASSVERARRRSASDPVLVVIVLAAIALGALATWAILHL